MAQRGVVGTGPVTGAIAFDLTRQVVGLRSSVPRGIDRIDHAYARHFFEQWSGDAVGVLPTPWGMRTFNRDRSLRIVNFVEARWGEEADPDADPVYRWLKDRLLDRSPSVERPKERRAARRFGSGITQLLRQAGFSFGQRLATLPTGTVYLNTGQLGLALPKLLSWLAARSDVKPVFLLQDVIPLEYPEYAPRWAARGHRQMLASTARYAKGLVVTTQAAAVSIKRELARLTSSRETSI